MITKILVIFIIIMTAVWTGGAIYLISGGRIFNRFYHNILNWHLPDDEPQEFDGCNIHTHCKYCGKEIIQDSQGNWY